MNATVSPEDYGNETIDPGRSTVQTAPGEREWSQLQGLLEFARGLERRNRVDMLLKGAVFSELKTLYQQYTRALYKAGFRKDEVATYQQFKAESGFSIPSNASISNYTQVYACYVVSYAMATLRRQENSLSYVWVDPLLLAAPFDMLVYLFRENYHNTAERAREILYNLQPEVMKRSDFWLWLEKQNRVAPKKLPPALVDENTPPDKPYQDSIQEVYERYEIASPDFDWNPLMRKIAIPDTVKRPLRITVVFSEVEYGKPNTV
jgi:hypothetical protein